MVKPSNHFDQRSKEWDQDPAKVERAGKVAQLIRPQIQGHKGMIALEYGCGTGLLSQALANDFKKIILADTSDGMLEMLAGKISHFSLNHFHPVKLDLIADTNYPRESVDVIYSLLTLHHIPETQQILDAFYQTLKPGGRIFLADLDKEDGTFHPAGTEDIHFGFDRSELATLASQSGFTKIHFVDAFQVHKEGNGIPRSYPVFLMDAAKAAFINYIRC